MLGSFFFQDDKVLQLQSKPKTAEKPSKKKRFYFAPKVMQLFFQKPKTAEKPSKRRKDYLLS
jgi:hypothetical protein